MRVIPVCHSWFRMQHIFGSWQNWVGFSLSPNSSLELKQEAAQINVLASAEKQTGKWHCSKLPSLLAWKESASADWQILTNPSSINSQLISSTGANKLGFVMVVPTADESPTHPRHQQSAVFHLKNEQLQALAETTSISRHASLI